jgi:hypothetical protein
MEPRGKAVRRRAGNSEELDHILRAEHERAEEEEQTASVLLEARIVELVALMLRRLLSTELSLVREVEGAAAVLGAGAVMLEALAATTGESPPPVAARWCATSHELLALVARRRAFIEHGADEPLD